MFDISSLGIELQSICQKNCPVRTKPPSGPSGSSPYPGNLRQNGINLSILNDKHARVVIGGQPAPYGPYTETRSHKAGWMQQSVNEFVAMLINRYGGTLK